MEYQQDTMSAAPMDSNIQTYGPQLAPGIVNTNAPVYGPQMPPGMLNTYTARPTMFSRPGAFMGNMGNVYANARMQFANASKSTPILHAFLLFLILIIIVLVILNVLVFAKPSTLSFADSGTNLAIGQAFLTIGSVLTFGLTVFIWYRLRKLQ